ncbi:MAG: hypothetical protein EZS28_007459 [Streblomastix strix]|uniref:GHMP kinase N-terminal domain-containing protein n=1 Tax=Streblomastix strix TaxID=222440 RepID=A0A5J4WQ66_9EUKA|nr:MAG: hypothetical protein EZS28_007459 [Streblomastix strix]
MQGCAPIIEICCSAPGKIILFGEHAVVYGTNALLGAINLRTQCSVSKPRDAIQSDLVIIINQDDVRYVYTIRKTEICDVFHEINAMQSKLTLSSDFSDSQLQYDENKTYKAIQSHIFEKFKKKEIIEIPEQFLNSIRCVLGVLTASICHQATNFKIFNESNIPCYIEFTSTIPIGCGIGSSAAFNSSLSASLFMFFKFQANQSLILSHYSIPGKLTGAGGGGCVFGLLQDQMDQLLIKAVCEDLSAAGFEPFVARVGEDGVRIELLK